jgi:excinuclease ABC subunit A
MDQVSPSSHLIITGARQHNLKNTNLTLPKNQLIVFTGVSGSGKSSMAHDTIYAEGQRRYVESLSSYARQFLGVMDKPDVDKIEGLSPAIMIDQKQGSHNPRSTVGTVTEIYDYLRLLYARIAIPHCPNCGREVSPQEAVQIRDSIYQLVQTHELMDKQKGVRLLVLAPIIKNKKGEFKDLFNNLYKKGVLEARVDGEIIATNSAKSLFKNNRHNIEAVIDRIVIPHQNKEPNQSFTLSRLIEAIESALALSAGEVIAAVVKDAGFSFPDNPKDLDVHLFSEHLACPVCNISLPQLEPRHFSFNAPAGACPTCTGLGSKLTLNIESVIAPDLTLLEGAIIPLSSQFENNTWFARLITHVMAKAGFDNKTPLKKLTDKQNKILLEGTGDKIHPIKGLNSKGLPTVWHTAYSGLIAEFERRHQETSSDYVRGEMERFMVKKVCPDCLGARLKKEILATTLEKLSISDFTSQSVKEALIFTTSLSEKLGNHRSQIATPIVKEIVDRLEFLNSVGLNYLTLNREAGTLSGGELQRIRLSAQIGSRLTGILYVLDEPTIGLHQQDNHKLIKTLRDLVNLGNTLVVVEHDRDMIEAADHLVEFGPLAGELGGEITFQGSVGEINKSDSLTGKYLSGKNKIEFKTKTHKRGMDPIVLENCSYHNLKDVSVTIPCGKLIGITGVSGSGKSSLVVDTLHEAMARNLNRNHKHLDIEYGSIEIPSEVKKVSLIDQSPIGRTPRSNPATYTKVFDYIRKVYANTHEARERGYNQGRFSFNVKGGRCETCQGEGQIKIEMQFMGDIYISCETCNGSRFNQPTLEVEYKNKTISDVLNMTIDEARTFFKSIPIIDKKLETLQKVGLGYIRLGQPAPTLSGGEAQRIKLAAELAKTNAGHTVYLLDEPTTGLHFHDLVKLLQTLRGLVNNDNTVIVIEHNLDLIKNTDYIIDMGPEGGDNGGKIIAKGTPQDIIYNFETPTALELKKYLS